MDNAHVVFDKKKGNIGLGSCTQGNTGEGARANVTEVVYASPGERGGSRTGESMVCRVAHARGFISAETNQKQKKR